MATTESGITMPASPSDVGRHLRSVRKARGLSRAEVARSAGLTRRELAAYERGKSAVPDSDLWCLAGSVGVDVSELLPGRDRLTVGSDLGALTVGESVRRLRSGTGSEGVLREYVAMVYELRNLPPGTRPPMRDEDLATLADALGGTAEVIEARLHELIGASHDEASRLRSMILPPRPLSTAPAEPPLAAVAPPAAMPAPVAEPAVVGAAVGGGAFPAPAPGGEYPPPTFDFATPAPSIGDPAAADRFFGAPQAEDPFAAPPPLAPLSSTNAPGPGAPTPSGSLPPLTGEPAGPSPTVSADAFPPPVAAPIDPFAPPTAAPIDPFAVPAVDPAAAPTGEPIAGPAAGAEPAAAPDPWGPEPSAPSPAPDSRPDGFVVDVGLAWEDAAEAWIVDVGPADGAATTFGDDPFAAADRFDRGGMPADPFATGLAPVEEDFVAFVAPLPTDGPVPHDDAARAADEGFEAVAGLGDAAEVDVASPGDDPLAALRVPLDDVTEHTDAVEAVTDTVEAVDVVTEVTEVTEVVEAVTEVAETIEVAGPVDDPGDDWFDRAAAAADALIADRLHDEPAATSDTDPVFDRMFDQVFDRNVDGTIDEELDASSDQELDQELDQEVDQAVDQEPDRDDDEHGETPGAASPDPVAAEVVAAEVVAEPTDALVDPEPTPIVWSPQASATAADEAAAPSEPAAGDDAAAVPVGAGGFVAAGAHWEVGGIFPATAMADDGALALRRADVRWALADVVAGRDFTVRATVSFTSGAGYGLLFRVSTDTTERITGYSFDVDPIYSGGGFLVRQWTDSRQHWKPLAHAPVADGSRLYGDHVLELDLRDDTLVARIDGETVMTVDRLSRRSIDAGHEPCRGGRLGIQAWSTTEVTVDRFLVADR